jgi:hypothetical protein
MGRQVWAQNSNGWKIKCYKHNRNAQIRKTLEIAVLRCLWTQELNIKYSANGLRTRSGSLLQTVCLAKGMTDIGI